MKFQDFFKKSEKKGPIREWVETIVIAVILALIIRAFVVEVFLIPSGSMEPTLYPHFGSKLLWIIGRDGQQDWLSDRVVVNKFIYKFREPKRFDVVVFKFPYTKPGEKQVDYIKRLIGLPGEKVEINNGFVQINGQVLQENHPLFRDNANYGPVTVPQGQYFMMGDNRSNSADSRYWGFLPKEKVIGPAFFKIWPLWRIGLVP